MRFHLPLRVLTLLAAAAAPASAQEWRSAGDGRFGWDRPAPFPIHAPSREGKVEVTRFLAESGAQALGHGVVSVTAAPGGLADEHEQATYEAAVIDRLAGVGYDTATKADGGQKVELTVLHAEVEPAEVKTNPVHGSMSVGADSRGGSYAALAIGVDAHKPRQALVSTRLEARILDVRGTVLWEGRADMATREGNPKWTQQAIAEKLAGALFSGFPGKDGETIAAR